MPKPKWTKQRYNEYMRDYLPKYRAGEREMIKEYKKLMGIPMDKRRKKN